MPNRVIYEVRLNDTTGFMAVAWSYDIEKANKLADSLKRSIIWFELNLEAVVYEQDYIRESIKDVHLESVHEAVMRHFTKE